MKSTQVHFYLTVLSFLFLSCYAVSEDDAEEYISARSSVTSFIVTAKTVNTVTFSAKASWHNGCGRFSQFTVSKTDSIFNVTIYGKQPKSAICTQAFIEFDAPVVIAIHGAGTYTFKFWQSENSSLDTTIVF